MKHVDTMARKLDPNGPTIHMTAKVRNSVFGKYTEVDERVRITDSEIGDYSYVLHDSETIYCTIGKFCAIAPFTRINPGNHPTWRPSMSNITYRSADYDLGDNDQEFFEMRRKIRVEVGHDVWIGQGALIMPGVKLGIGCVVAGGAVVTKDVEPYTIVAGVPARPIRKRFELDVQAALLRIAWWDWGHDTLRQAMPDMRCSDIRDFCKKYDR